MENVKATVKQAKIAALQHYNANWFKYEYYTALGFFGVSLMSGAIGVVKSIRHHSLRANYTTQDYHRMVRRQARFNSLIATSWLMVPVYYRILPYCENKLRELKHEK